MPEVNTALLVALMPAVIGLVNFVKAFGLTGKWITLVSMVIGIVLALAAQLLPTGTFSNRVQWFDSRTRGIRPVRSSDDGNSTQQYSGY